jgi:hypothetical protein
VILLLFCWSIITLNKNKTVFKMEKFFLLNVLIGFLSLTSMAQVGVNTNTPNASSNLTVAPLGTDNLPKGTLLSAMTSAQRVAIVSPATGLIVYDLTVKCLMTNNGTPAAPVWECIGGSSSTAGIEYVKHFHYSLPSTIPKSTSDFNARSGTINTTTQTLLSNWLATNDPTQVAQLPVVNGIRLDIQFTQNELYRPLIVNTNPAAKSLIGVSKADISGLYQWPLPNNSLPANGYLNIDADNVLGWGWQNSNNLEREESSFRILGDEGALYRATFFGYNDGGTSSGRFNIHIILEKFAPQTGGIHN